MEVEGGRCETPCGGERWSRRAESAAGSQVKSGADVEGCASAREKERERKRGRTGRRGTGARRRSIARDAEGVLWREDVDESERT